MTYNDILNSGIKILNDHEVPNAKIDALLLMMEVFDINRGYLLAHGADELFDAGSKIDKYNTLIEQRAKRIPLQHILGYQDFMGLRFKVDENVLIPRYDTEILVEEVLKHIHDGMNIMDMCTGSGCILTSLLYYSNASFGLGVDINEKSLQIARENSIKLLEEKDDIKFSYINSNMFKDLDNDMLNSFDIIVSNPPYIETKVIETLDTEVKDYDPLIALDGGEDGLDFYKIIAKEAPKYLKKGGMLFLEIGYDQHERVSKLLTEAGFINIEGIKDYAGLDRVLMALWPVM